MSELVHYEVRDRVAVLTIDNPPVNALGPGVWEAIDEAIARASGDAGVDAMVLIGAGATFIAGADINVFKILKTPRDSMDRSAGTHGLLVRWEDAPKPLVAAIHGNALGGGLEVAMACHYRVAAKDAKVGQPEVNLGIIPGAGGTQRLPRLAGAALALEMCMDGKPVAAAKAKAAGIVDEVVEGDLLSGAIAFAGARAAAGERRKTREIAFDAEATAAGRAACEKARASLKAGFAAPYAVVDAIEAALTLPFDRGSARERELFADCVVSTESKAHAPPLLRRARGRARSRRRQGHADAGGQARGRDRRGHHGRRHRDELRERRHSGAPEGGRRRGAPARPRDHPQELRVARSPRAGSRRTRSSGRWRSSRRPPPTTASTAWTSWWRPCSRTWTSRSRRSRSWGA